MATFNLELNSRPNKDKTYTILLRITQNRQHKRIKTTISIANKNDFNPKAKYGKWIRASEPYHVKWNTELENDIEKAKDTFRELKKEGIATKENIIATINEEQQSDSLLEYLKDRINTLDREGAVSNRKKHNNLYNKIKEYLTTKRKKDISFKEVNRTFITGFQSFLKTSKNIRQPERTLHPNTIAVHLRLFRTIINRAIAERLLMPNDNPFIGLTISNTKTTKEKLSIEDIDKIETLQLEEDSLLNNVRLFFLFAFYTAGTRVGDLLCLKWENVYSVSSGQRLKYVMQKNDKIRDITLLDDASYILSKFKTSHSTSSNYIFPFLDSKAEYALMSNSLDVVAMEVNLFKKRKNAIGAKTALINKYLKKIANLSEIKTNLTTHIARHTFANYALRKGISYNIIRELLAHSNSKTTDDYMGNFNQAETDQALVRMFKDRKTHKQQEPNISELIKNITPEQEEAIRAIIQKQ